MARHSNTYTYTGFSGIQMGQRHFSLNTPRTRSVTRNTESAPRWFAFAVAVSVTFLLCLAINLRSFSELRAEIEQNKTLDAEVNRLNNDNLMIQEQVFNLKNDPATIEREARKLGMGRIGERVLVSAN